MNEYNDSYLMHFGIPGMKWGQRKIQRQAKKDARRYEALEKHSHLVSYRNKKKLSKAIEKRASNSYYAKEFLSEYNTQRSNTKSYKQLKTGYKKSIAKTKRNAKRTINGAKNVITGKNIVRQMTRGLNKSVDYVEDHTFTGRGYQYIKENMWR